MIERNAVRRALASAGGNASKGMMAMALTLSLSPVQHSLKPATVK